MAVSVAGIVLVLIFFVGLFAFGVVVSWRTRRANNTTRSMMIANKDIGLVVGTLTLTATWIGSSALFGVAEQIYKPGFGLLWTQVPFAFAFASIVAVLFVVPRLSDKGFVTILDPIQNKFGKEIMPFFYIIFLASDIAWVAAILSSLSAGITVITGVSNAPAVILTSACFVLTYTVLGGLYAVAYTDVLQFVFIVFGLALATPFVVTNKAVKGLTTSNVTGASSDWLGVWNPEQTGYWIDSFLVVGLGYCVCQSLFQRIFAMKSVRLAQVATVLSFGIYFLILTPPAIIGAAAYNTNWSMTDYIDHKPNNNTPIENGEAAMIFAIAIKHLTPSVVGYVALAAVSSAAMSSADSAILASSSLFTQNIYNPIIRKKASDNELKWATRGAMVVVTSAGAGLAFVTTSIYGLVVVSADLLYITVLPQVVATIYLDPNSYGAIVSLILTCLLRVLAGEPMLNFQGVIQFPGNEFPRSQFPVKTFLMLFCLATTALFSFIFKKLFKAGIIPKKYDFLDSRLSEGGRTYFHGNQLRLGSTGGDIFLHEELRKRFSSFDE